MSIRPGITTISDPDKVQFTPLGEVFLKKHGQKRCPCCREIGLNRVVEIGPSVGGETRMRAAVCYEHEDEGRAMFRRIWHANRPDDSEAEYSLPVFR